MHTRTVILTTVLFAIIIAGMFVFAFLKKKELNEHIPASTDEEQVTTTPYDYITRIDAKHFFIDGVHTIAGSVQMPTPCDLLESSSRVMESYPEQVAIDFSVINTADMCAQVMTEQRFMTSFTASEAATIRAMFMGRAIELNLIPAAEGETPEDFELYIKG